MSAKKVKKVIRQQRRDRRRAEREQARRAKAAQQAQRAAEKKAAAQQAAEAKASAKQASANQAETKKAETKKAETEKAQTKTAEAQTAEARDAGRPAGAQAQFGGAAASSAAVSEAPAQEPLAAERTAEDTPADESPASAEPEAAASAAAAEKKSRRTGSRRSAVRVGAVVVTAALVGVGAGSAVTDFSGSDRAPLAPVAGSGVASPQTGQTYLCPPMPGQADSLTTDGILDYASRDGSASSLFQSLVLAEDGAELPEAHIAQITSDGQLNRQSLSGGQGVIHHAEPGQQQAPVLGVSAGQSGDPLTAAGLFEYHADQGPVTGLAVGECGPAQQNHWFFGPETGPGATSLLTLSNPYDRASTVEVTTYDADGERGARGARSIVVPPQTVRTVNMAALSGGSVNMGVEVSATGAPVGAQMQSSRAAGLTGTGAEFLPSAQGLQDEHVIPGVPMADTSSEGAADDPTSMPAELWLHVPGDETTTVELQVFGEDGQVALESPAVFTVEGGQVDVLELLGPQADVYDVVVRTDNPSAAAVASRGMGELAELGAEDEAAAEDAAQQEGEELDEGTLALDFSWGVAAEPLTETSGAILPEIGRTEDAETDLQLSSPEGGTVSYRLLAADGEFSEPQQTEVPAGRSVTVPAEELAEVTEDAVAVVVDPPADEGVYASLLTTDDQGRFSLSRVSPLQDDEATVPVRLR
ncbi:DUF5719 family protein [Nesterenkonia lacusekhoensis]|uniref:Uncharacterized protein n=1 Tax=Nesterenkonia lacusekhoensis TaxID=150832 RepID=A0ABS4SZ92_9MICC|nr:DUF5719 family protein [Nesterenkonia lacusekhoensis]MBP2317521.1 hypothetical protein [Nesterenkonia lacusekhoensis]